MKHLKTQLYNWIIGITDKVSGYEHPDGTYRRYPKEFTWYRWRFQNNSIMVWRFRLVWWDYGESVRFQFRYASPKGSIINMQESRWLNLVLDFRSRYLKHIYFETR